MILMEQISFHLVYINLCITNTNLGLEPSDDESSSDSDFTSFDESKSQISSSEEHSTNNRLELYLLKKKLRLESARLVQRAKLCIPINAASRQYVNSVGAALRVRKANMSKENGKMKENRVQQCAHVTQQQVFLFYTKNDLFDALRLHAMGRSIS